MNDILFNYFNQQNIFTRLFKFQLTKLVIITTTIYQAAVNQIRKSVERSFKLQNRKKRELSSKIVMKSDGMRDVNSPNEDLLLST